METQIQNQLQNLAPENVIQRPPLSELYSEIQLTDEEKAAAIERALFEARSQKAAMIARAEYQAKVLTEPVVVRYTAKQLYEHLKALPDFVIDDDNQRVVWLLCMYFTESEKFESYTDDSGRNYSLTKGILLFGGVGVGKTKLLELFRNNQKSSYQVVTCQDVEGVYAKNGPDMNEKTGELGLRKYFGFASLPVKNAYGQSVQGFMFDDLGQENQSTKFFGTERNVMQEVLSQRYKNNLHEHTHLTTNLSGAQITDAYGIRVGDRMREMFNLIAFPENAKSRRR